MVECIVKVLGDIFESVWLFFSLFLYVILIEVESFK